jgi:hypothetical protein
MKIAAARRRFPWLAVILFAAGCTTVGPDFVQPKAPALDPWPDAGRAGITTKPVEQIRWWEAFGDR